MGQDDLTGTSTEDYGDALGEAATSLPDDGCFSWGELADMLESIS